MSLRFDLRVDDSGASDRFDLMSERARNPRPVLLDVLDLLHQGEKRRFNSSAGWEGLSAATRARDQRKDKRYKSGRDPRLMRASGALERALTIKGEDPSISDVGKDTLRFGIKGGRTPVYYGRFHDLGDGVPRRQVLVFSSVTRKRTSRVVTDYFAGR